MPSEPVINIHELARNWAAGDSRVRYSVSGAIRQAATPAPIRTRAAIRAHTFGASANATQPNTATLTSANKVRRGPKRSSAVPRGNCMQAKPRK